MLLAELYICTPVLVVCVVISVGLRWIRQEPAWEISATRFGVRLWDDISEILIFWGHNGCWLLDSFEGGGTNNNRTFRVMFSELLGSFEGEVWINNKAFTVSCQESRSKSWERIEHSQSRSVVRTF